MQADLAVMLEFGTFKYFLLMIDIFSRKIFTHPMKTKTAAECRRAFDILFKEADIVPEKLETDKGSYFNMHIHIHIPSSLRVIETLPYSMEQLQCNMKAFSCTLLM